MIKLFSIQRKLITGMAAIKAHPGSFLFFIPISATHQVSSTSQLAVPMEKWLKKNQQFIPDQLNKITNTAENQVLEMINFQVTRCSENYTKKETASAFLSIKVVNIYTKLFPLDK